MSKMNGIVKQMIVSMLVLPACQAEAADVEAVVGEAMVQDAGLQEELLAAAKPEERTKAARNPVVEALLNKARYWKQQGRMDLAVNSWERVLRSNPAQEEALAGLALYHASVGHSAQAAEYLDKLKQVNPKNPIVIAVERVLSPATSSNNAAAEKARANLMKAVAPVTPWDILDQARSQRKQGDAEGANRKVAQMAALKPGDRDSNYAGAIYFSESNQWTEALNLLDRIPAKDRNELIMGLRARAVVHARSEHSRKLYRGGAEQEAIDMMGKAEADAIGNPELVSMAASTWVEMKQFDRAIALLERNKPLTPGLQQQYAGVLLQAGRDDKLGQMFAEMDAADEDTGALDRIRLAYSVRHADVLRDEGRVGEGMMLLKPMLEKFPHDVDLQLSYARMLGSAGQPIEGLKAIDAALASDPGNHEAIRQGVVYAIQTENYPLADHYLSLSSQDDARRYELYAEAGHTAEAYQNKSKATSYFTVAKRVADGKGVVDITISPERTMAGSESRQESYVETAYSMRYKSGAIGLDYLYETEVPIAWHIPLEEGHSSLVAKATQVTLDAGDVASAAGLVMDRFGTNNPLPLVPATYPIRASGIALSLGYQSTALSADIGVTPMGFKVMNVVGGVRWNTDMSGSNLSVEAVRRPVTDSVLSYAGVTDNNLRAGQAWGGVVKTGGHLGYYYPFGGDWAVYASGGFYTYDGLNVAQNSSYNTHVTMIYQLARTDDYVVTISGQLGQMGFDNNQRWYLWGHGGYYSPKSHSHLSIPFHLHGKGERSAYEFNFTPSITNVTEEAALTYPTDAVLQAGVPAPATLPATVRNGRPTWKMNWTYEYQILPQFAIGNRSHYEQSQTYDQLGTMFYLRYDIEKAKQAMPPNPIRPYYLSTEGGAALN